MNIRTPKVTQPGTDATQSERSRYAGRFDPNGAICNRYARPKAPAEIVFGVLRLLLADRLFWGVQARLTVTSLGELMGVPESEVARALAGLHGEGLVRVHLAEDGFGLTEIGAEQLC